MSEGQQGAAVQALPSAIKPIVDELHEAAPFANRGFSERTVRAILGCGIDAPERLLFMSEEQLRAIPGIGRLSFKEIVAYRGRFLT